MRTIRALIVDDDGHIVQELERSSTDTPSDPLAFLEILKTSGADNALEQAVLHNPSLCLIRVDGDFTTAHKILDGLNEAGLKMPVTLIVSPQDMDQEARLVKRGAEGVIPCDGALGPVVRYIVRYTHALKTAESQLRTDKEILFSQILDLRDERERAEEQSVRYLEMAEELSLAKENLERLNQEKNKLFSIIAHDLRSPFTALLGYTGMIAQMSGKLTSEQISKFAQDAHNSGMHIFKLLENLLEWARLQMNRVDFSPSQQNLKDIATRTLDILMPLAKEKNITLECQLDDTSAYIDPYVIETVVRNLVNNAIKFTPSGGHISIFAETFPEHIAISVRDNGVGMSANRLGKIFSIAENSSTNGTNGEPGTGLGVILCKELVERGKGQLQVVSKEGEGTTFTFTVPRFPEAAAATGGPPAHGESSLSKAAAVF